LKSSGALNITKILNYNNYFKFTDLTAKDMGIKQTVATEMETFIKIMKRWKDGEWGPMRSNF